MIEILEKLQEDGILYLMMAGVAKNRPELLEEVLAEMTPEDQASVRESIAIGTRALALR